jgi:hypothetical protein
MAAKRNGPSEVERLKQELKQEIAVSDERLRVCEDAKRSVIDLIRLSAGGNRHVVYTVFVLAHQLVAVLNSIVIPRPELGRWLARDTIIWPAFISRKRALRRANEELLDKLHLGEGGIFNIGESHLDAPSTWAAIAVFYAGLSRAIAGQCPSLSRENKKQWFAENYTWLLAKGLLPEQHDVLRNLGASKAKKKPKYCKQLHPATQRANLRSEIKARVWQAFDKIIKP